LLGINLCLVSWDLGLGSAGIGTELWKRQC